MKIRIKTAHGYLSFQPDGRIEYRRNAGPWEDLDVEGLTFEPAQPAPPAPGQPTPDDAGPTPEPTVAYVAATKSWLAAQGISLSGACGAFELTRRVAWGLRRAGYGLLAKPSGNNCRGFATDVIVMPNRTGIVDLLGDAGTANNPSWQERENEVTPDRWRAPEKP